jgi:hypothetical protein
MRNNFKKVCAVVLCIGILSLAAPGAFAIQKKSPKLNLFKFFGKQIVSITTLFTTLPVLDFLYPNPQDEIIDGNKQIKVTGGLNVDRLGEGD